MSDRRTRRVVRIAVLLVASVFGCQREEFVAPYEQPAQQSSRPAVKRVAVPLERNWSLLTTQAVTVNGEAVGRFVIDTGSNVTWVDDEVARRLKLPSGRPAHAGRVCGSLVRVNSLAIAGIDTGAQFIVISDTSELSAVLDLPVAGVLGGTTLAKIDFTVEMATPRMVIYEGSRPKALGERHKFTLMGQVEEIPGAEGIPAVSAVLNDSIDALTVLDTGHGLPVVLGPTFTHAHPELATSIPRPHAIAASTRLQDPFAARIRTLRLFGRVFGPSLLRGACAYRLTNVAGERKEEDAIVGRPLLKRFALTFDYDNRDVWARPVEVPSMAKRLAEGLDPDAKDITGMPIAAFAIREGDLEGLKALQAAGADLRARSRKGTNLLHYAVMGSNPAILAYLLNQEKGPSVNHAQRKGITPLMLAVKRYHNEHIKPLLAAGANVGAVDHRDVGALHYAAQVGNTAAIRILLKAGADCNARTRDGFTPLTVAAANAHLDAFNELLRYGAETHLDDDAQNRTVYHFAAHGGSAAIIRAIAESVPALKVGAVAGGYTPLMMAAENGHVDAVRALIGVGADPQGTGTRGGTALHVAAQAARVEVMDVLLRAGADVDQATTGGVTPLMLAAGRGRHRAVRYLLDQGANPKLRDNKGRSAADIARMEGHEKLAERLSRLASAD